MTFQITINYYKKVFRYTVEQVHLDDRTERYKIIAKNAVIEIVSNRPFYRNRNLKHRSDWKQIEGKCVSDHVLQLISEAIQKYLEKEGE
jgi:hypothetical protein